MKLTYNYELILACAITINYDQHAHQPVSGTEQMLLRIH